MASQRTPLERIIASLQELLRFAASDSLRIFMRELPTFQAIVERRIAVLCRGRPRRDSALRCIPVRAKVHRRPDPMIYSQSYLMQQGLAVTWDNPDIRIEKSGVAVPAHALDPDTEYTIVARVWNGSTDAPALHLPVRFTVFGFGMGLSGTELGETHVNLGVKGSAACPAFAAMKWRTPPTGGHFCIQVLLVWSDDANPLNNLGQTNTDVRPLNTPRARFAFAVGNQEREPRTVRLVADGYRMPPRERCPERQTDADAAARRGRLRERHARERHPVPRGWRVAIEPAELDLAPGEERPVEVVLTAPADDFAGRVTVNVNGFAGESLVGGVTLHAEGRGHG